MRRAGLVTILLSSLAAAILLVACSRPELDAGEGEPTGDELYADTFDSATGAWLLEADDDGGSQLVDGALIITVNVPNTIQFATLTEQEFADFVAEVDVVQLQGDLESSYGLLFRKQEDGRFYRFDITGDGRYIVERRDTAGEWTRLTTDWRSSTALVSGLNSANRLRVEARGAAIRVYANGVLLEELVDAALAEGTLALDAGTFGRPGLEVAYDNLVVWEP